MPFVGDGFETGTSDVTLAGCAEAGSIGVALPGYAGGMKTAVSIPDDIFERAERLAMRNRRSRSEVYADAPDEVMDTTDSGCEEVRGEKDAFLAAAARRVLDKVEW